MSHPLPPNVSYPDVPDDGDIALLEAIPKSTLYVVTKYFALFFNTTKAFAAASVGEGDPSEELDEAECMDGDPTRLEILKQWAEAAKEGKVKMPPPRKLFGDNSDKAAN